MPSGSAFNSITLETTNPPGYTISGNAIQLLAGLTSTNNSVHTVNLPLTLLSAQTFTLSSGGTLSLNGSLDNGGFELIANSFGTLPVSGNISGAGGITKLGFGGLALNGSNSFLGTVNVLRGVVSAGHNQALGAGSAGTFVTNNATAGLQLAGGVSITESLTLGHASGTATLIGVGTNVWGGAITLAGSTANTRIQTDGLLTINGALSGNGFQKENTGLLILNGNGSQTNSMTIVAGKLQVNGQQPASSVVMNSLVFGEISGTGSVKDITTLGSGTLSPGSSPGTLTCSNLTLAAGTTTFFELNGSTPGIGYDQLKVNGTVNLAGAQLSLALNYTPANGTKFVIITNTGASPVTGTFAGLPEGASITQGATTMAISYVGGNGNDVVLTVGCLAPCNLVIHDGPTPYLVYVRWDRPLGPVDEYIVYRNGLEVARMGADIFFNFPLYYDPYLQPSRSYTYQVVATFTNGAVSVPSDPLVVVTPAATPVMGTNDVVNLLVRFADYVEEPYSTNYANALMFTNQYSAAAYYREASYGQYDLRGSSHGWFTLPGYGSNYCAFINPGNGLWYGPNMGLIAQDTLAVIPAEVSNLVATADIVQYLVHGLGTVGLSGGYTKMYSATNGFTVGSVLHEISHGINNFGHSGGWHDLPGGYSCGPELLDLLSGGCGLSTYGDWYDPLGGGATVHHHTYFKEKAGWLQTNNIAWIDHDGTYQVWAIELNTNKTQMLKFNLGNEMFYFFEYRTMTGFDGPSTPGPGLPSFDGVLGRLRLSFSQGGDIETVIPYPKPFFVPRIFNPGTPFLDPYRNLRVEVVSKSGGVATLRVSGLTNVFRLTNVRTLGAGGQNVELTFNSLPDAKYLAQASTNFTTWQTVRTNIFAPTNSTVTVLTNAGALPFRFFRVGVDNTSP